MPSTPSTADTILGAPPRNNNTSSSNSSSSSRRRIYFSRAMGYSERVCQLCGASFNVGRIRRADEGGDAAWMWYGYGFVDGRAGEGGSGNGVGAVKCAPDSTGCRFEGRASRWGEEGEFEHLAGPRCASLEGYSGWRIGVGELKPMTRVQCLMPKDETWTPEPDDAHYEAESKCFLSGVSQIAPDEFSVRGRDFLPVRHGVTGTDISNCGEYGWGIPFHAQCFEIYKRVCEREIGEVDVDALWELRELEGDYGNDGWDDLERCPELRKCRQQWWQHEVGTEWLVADPITIPFLQQKLLNPPQLVLKPKKSPMQAQEQEQEQSNSANTAPASAPTKTTPTSTNQTKTTPSRTPTPPPTDPFQRLSNELLLEIMLYLRPHDVAHLRLSSRAFTHLPELLFRHFIRVEMPWLWEMETLKPSSSSSVANPSSSSSSSSSSWVAGLRYRNLYTALKGPGASPWLQQLLGLRNRRRIWRDIEVIVKKVVRLREEGEGAWPRRKWRGGEAANVGVGVGVGLEA